MISKSSSRDLALMCRYALHDRRVSYKIYRHKTLGLVLAIAGSNLFEDWWTNIACGANKLGYHHGFYKRSLALPVLSFDVVTGYSLGGAVATIYSLERKTPWCVTFNAPGAVLSKAKPSSTTKFTRYVCQGDLVSKLPPWFTHPKSEVIEVKPLLKSPHALENYLKETTKHGNT